MTCVFAGRVCADLSVREPAMAAADHPGGTGRLQRSHSAQGRGLQDTVCSGQESGDCRDSVAVDRSLTGIECIMSRGTEQNTIELTRMCRYMRVASKYYSLAISFVPGATHNPQLIATRACAAGRHPGGAERGRGA